MDKKVMRRVLAIAITIFLGIVIGNAISDLLATRGQTVATLRKQTEAARQTEPITLDLDPVTIIDTPSRSQLCPVRDVHIPGSALTVAPGWSTTCTVTFVDGTTQVAVLALAR
jgi:hypothetical protein